MGTVGRNVLQSVAGRTNEIAWFVDRNGIAIWARGCSGQWWWCRSKAGGQHVRLLVWTNESTKRVEPTQM